MSQLNFRRILTHGIYEGDEIPTAEGTLGAPIECLDPEGLALMDQSLLKNRAGTAPPESLRATLTRHSESLFSSFTCNRMQVLTRRAPIQSAGSRMSIRKDLTRLGCFR
jgi:hypothetical protein